MEFVRTMDLTSKQRAQLRGLANGIDTILIVGKEGIGDNLVKQANDALEARELIKGRVLENALMSAREAAEALLPTYQRVRLDHEEGFQVGWTFQEGPEAGGEAAEILTVPFSTYKTGVFEYDPDSGLYLVEEYGEPYVDGNTGEQVAVKNVLVLYTDVSQLSGDSAGRLKVRTTGSGGGLLVRDGLAWPITWEREGESDRLSFYREDGQPAALGVGHSYINIVKTGTEVTWAAKSPEEAG